MEALTKEQRNQLAKVVLDAREKAEVGARKALRALGVDEAEAPSPLGPDERVLRRALRAQARQLGDSVAASGRHEVKHLTEKIAYDQWHRMLFARFLAENDLLMSPEHGVPVSLDDCRDLAPELGLRDGWAVAARFAAQMLPQIFSADDPAGKIELAHEDRNALQQLVVGLPRDTFMADDSLGWVYQFWQAKRKDEVNKSEKKIGADELAAVTQLFTEDYMVLFLLHNTVGAWWAGRMLPTEVAKSAPDEETCRQAVALPGVEWTYLRFVRDEQSESWRPAAGTFESWPRVPRELRILDPCMGSGHFLVAALPMVAAMRMKVEGFSKAYAVLAALRDNLFGLELDLRCTQIAAFNLALAAWKVAGYQRFPPLNLACSGLGPNAPRETWLKLANGDERLRWGMGQLYDLFKDAPTLGSLIEPARAPSIGFSVSFQELQPLLAKALAREVAKHDDEAHEMGVTAKGLAHAAEILASEFNLVCTNVPYLSIRRQSGDLRRYLEASHSEGKACLSTAFVMRCLGFCKGDSSIALVTPQHWLFQDSYERLRRKSFTELHWRLAIKLGAGAFETISGEVVNVALVVISNRAPVGFGGFHGFDCSSIKSIGSKRSALIEHPLSVTTQVDQTKNPDARLSFDKLVDTALLETFAHAPQGVITGDLDKWQRCFWELPNVVEPWQPFLSTTPESGDYRGREHVVDWRDEGRTMIRPRPGNRAVGNLGVAVSQIGDLPVSLYLGELYDGNVAPIIPADRRNLPALWAFCESDEFRVQLRKLDKGMKVTNGVLLKAPFDLVRWEKVAAEKYPSGIPKPHSVDATQWVSGGNPGDSEQPLQVAIARLVAYRWPLQTGSSLPGCSAIGSDGLEAFADDDGIVCISAVKSEAPAADRLRALLAVAFGAEWSSSKQAELLAQVGYAGKTLEDWLRNGFFEQHFQLFHQRPFIWHVWDGLRDGFSALVNYHKLDRANLEKLTYTYLGDWIARLKAAVEAGEEGSDARLRAARQLQEKLRLILEGEQPYDIFIRWKPLEKQPIGWEPDLNDGVRLNIRPFVAAGVLRKNPKINWNKDRGKDVSSAPWYNRYDRRRVPNYQPGDRINDYHLTLAEKLKAREKA